MLKKNNDTTLRNFFLSDKNISMIFNLILNNFAKRNLKPNNQMIIDELKESHLNIMNLVFQSKDYYLQLENLTNISDIMKFLNRKVIDRCNIDFTKILQNDKLSKISDKIVNNEPKGNDLLLDQFQPIINEQSTNDKSIYKTTDYSNMTVQNALDTLIKERDLQNSQKKSETPIKPQIPIKPQKQIKPNQIDKNNIDKEINEKSKKNNSIENIRLRIKKQKQNNETNKSNKLLNKINQLKSIQESITVNSINNINKNSISNLYFYSIQKNWSGFWNNITENKIIINRQLVKSPHNSKKYSYIIDIGKTFTKIKIKELILPLNRNNPNNIDLLLYVVIKNLQVVFPMKLTKQMNNLLYYDCNEIKTITNSLRKSNKLLIEIKNYDKQMYENNETDVFTISDIKMNSEGFFNIRFKEINYLSNKIITNDTLLIRNLNLNNFIKFNQSVKSEDIVLLENWFTKNEHS